jgi:hypothetical protein
MVEPSYQELSSSEIPSAHPTRNVLVKVICGESDGSPSEGIISSPVRPLGGCWFTDYTIKKKGEKVFQRIPKGWNAFVSFFPFFFFFFFFFFNFPPLSTLLYSTLFSLVDTALCFLNSRSIKQIYTLSGSLLVGPPTPSVSNLIPPFHTAILSNNDPENPLATGISLESASQDDEEVRFVVISGEPLVDQEIVQHGPFVMDTKEGILQAFKDFRDGKNGFEGAQEWKSKIGGR